MRPCFAPRPSVAPETWLHGTLYGHADRVNPPVHKRARTPRSMVTEVARWFRPPARPISRSVWVGEQMVGRSSTRASIAAAARRTRPPQVRAGGHLGNVHLCGFRFRSGLRSSLGAFGDDLLSED